MITDIPFESKRVVAGVTTVMPPTMDKDLSYVIKNDPYFFKYKRDDELISIIEKSEKNIDINYLPILKNEVYSLELSTKNFKSFREALEESVRIIYL